MLMTLTTHGSRLTRKNAFRSFAPDMTERALDILLDVVFPDRVKEEEDSADNSNEDDEDEDDDDNSAMEEDDEEESSSSSSTTLPHRILLAQLLQIHPSSSIGGMQPQRSNIKPSSRLHLFDTC